MVAAVLATVATLLYGSLIAWGAHWFIHRKWSGPFYRSHMNHHVQQYPPTDLLSERYRSAGKDDGLFSFGPLATIAFLPFVAMLFVLSTSVWTIGLVLVEAALIGFGHDWLHEKFHLNETRLSRFRWFLRFRARHFAHHWHVQKNLGIAWFGWDRLFGTFREP